MVGDIPRISVASHGMEIKHRFIDPNFESPAEAFIVVCCICRPSTGSNGSWQGPSFSLLCATGKFLGRFHGGFMALAILIQGHHFQLFDARMDWYLGIIGNFRGVHTSFPQLRNTDGTAMWLGNLLWDFDLQGTL